MLLGINPILNGELLQVLSDMGHGDRILLADGNFPASRFAKRLVRHDGPVLPLFKAILDVFPLDDFGPSPVQLTAFDDGTAPPLLPDVRSAVDKVLDQQIEITCVDRFAFVGLVESAFAIVSTVEPSLYANILLTKGVIRAKRSPAANGP